jgi:hypothetical protein
VRPGDGASACNRVMAHRGWRIAVVGLVGAGKQGRWWRGERAGRRGRGPVFVGEQGQSACAWRARSKQASDWPAMVTAGCC